MVELEPLASVLRGELGAPPEAWKEVQRARLRETLGRRPERTLLLRFAPVFAALLALAVPLVWFVSSESREPLERRFVAREVDEPFRFDDGSSIALAPGGRGRLVADDALVRFELESGRARFDVTPGQNRTWTITAGENEVNVVGTRFTVAYAPSEKFEVEVERGIVSVRVPERSAGLELRAGDRLDKRPGRLEVGRVAAASPPTAAVEPERTDEPEPEASRDFAPPSEPPAKTVAATDWQARYRDGKYAESLALLRASGVPGRLDELGASTLARVADAARLGGDPELAVRALNALARRFPRAPEARDVKFLLGRVHALRGDGNAAISAFEDYLRRSGSAHYANEAMGRLIELYSARGDDERARAMARRYLKAAPDGPYQRLAHSLAASGL